MRRVDGGKGRAITRGDLPICRWETADKPLCKQRLNRQKSAKVIVPAKKKSGEGLNIMTRMINGKLER